MIGSRIKRLRNIRGITQTELGNAIGVSKGLVSKYEIGRHEAPDDIKIKLANYFNVSVDYFLGLSAEPVSCKGRNNIKSIIIPNDFTDDDIKDIEKYIEFLVYKKR